MAKLVILVVALSCGCSAIFHEQEQGVVGTAGADAGAASDAGTYDQPDWDGSVSAADSAIPYSLVVNVEGLTVEEPGGFKCASTGGEPCLLSSDHPTIPLTSDRAARWLGQGVNDQPVDVCTSGATMCSWNAALYPTGLITSPE